MSPLQPLPDDTDYEADPNANAPSDEFDAQIRVEIDSPAARLRRQQYLDDSADWIAFGIREADKARAITAAETRRGNRDVTDDEIRKIADATSGSFSAKLNAVCKAFPIKDDGDGRSRMTFYRRMTMELGYKSGLVQQSKPPRRKCAVLECGREFQPTIKGDETRCRLHRR